MVIAVCSAILALGGVNASAQLDPNAYTSLAPSFTASSGTVTINTSAGTISNGVNTYTGVTQTQTNAGSITVFDFGSINIGSGVTVVVQGTNALALLSRGNASILTTIPIDASGAAGSGTPPTPGTAVFGGGNGGAGAVLAGVPASNGGSTYSVHGANGATAVSAPTEVLGGQDGAGGGNGGPGGTGGSFNGHTAVAGAATGDSPLAVLVGGGGGSGGPFVVGAASGPIAGAGGGAGGGAIEIIAKGTLTVSSLNSNGGNGGGIQPVDAGSQYGGGGAGGTLVLGGSALTVTGALNANGGAAVPLTGAGSGGGGAVALLGTPSWVLGSTTAAAGLGVTVNVNRGVGGSADGTAGTIQATTLGVTAPTGQTATFNGTSFTNVIPIQTQTPTTPAITVTLGTNLVLDGGTLQFTGTGETFGPANTFALTANGGMINTLASSDTVSSQITGPGGITKLGTGTLTLTAANTYTRNTNLNAGTLVIANSQALGTMGALNQNAGTLQTGGGNHVIGIGNDYTSSVGSMLVINITGLPSAGTASNDQVQVHGAAVLNGMLTINYNAAPILPGVSETYTIVTATGGVGAPGLGFTDPTVISGALKLTTTTSVANGGDDFDVTFMATQGLFSTIGGLTPNQTSVATYLDRIDASGVTNPGLTLLIDNLDTVSISSAALGAALNQLMPLNFAHFASSTAFNGTDFLTEQMDNYLAGHRSADGTFVASNDHLDYSGLTVNDPNTAQGLQPIRSHLLAWNPEPSTGLVNDSASSLLGGVDMKDTKKMIASEPANLWNVFVAGDVVLGQDFSDNTTGNAHADSTTGEIRVGADYAITPHFLIGGLVNYNHTDATIDAQQSKATVDGYMPGIYASYADSGWYANGLGTYAFNSYTQDRNVSIAGFDGRADSAPTGDQILGDLDGGYDFHFANFTVGPTAGLKYVHLDVNGYTEDGLPGASLRVDRDEADSLRSRLGGRVSYVFNGAGVAFTPHLDVSWLHEFLDASRGINSEFVGAGVGTFAVSTAAPSRDSALVNLGLDAKIDDTFTVFGNYTVQAGQENYFGQSVQAGLKIGF